MKDFRNNLVRHIDSEEMIAILEAGKLLEKAFKKTIFCITIMPNSQNQDDCYGVSFSFDLVMEGYQKQRQK